MVAWGGRAPAVLWVAVGLVGAGPWLPVGVGWLGGRRSCQQWAAAHVLSGEAGGAWCGAVYDRVGDACGWLRARSAIPFPASPDPWGVVVMLMVRVLWVPEWMIVPLVVPLARVVWALA